VVLLLPPDMMGLVREAIAVPGVVLSGAGAAAAWELPVLGACPGPLVSVPMSWSRARPGGCDRTAHSCETMRSGGWATHA